MMLPQRKSSSFNGYMDLNYLLWKLRGGFILILLQLVMASQATVSNIRLTSAEYSITLTFTPDPAATNYTASFRLRTWFQFTDYVLEPPYNSSVLSVTHSNGVLPGHLYVARLIETETQNSSVVFDQTVATVPLQPAFVHVVSRGSSFLVVQWESPLNFSYEGHEINYKHPNSSWQVVNGTSNVFHNLTDLDAGYSYQIFVMAVTADQRSRRSDTITASTLPLAPRNLNATAISSTQIQVTWEPQASSFQDSFQVRFSLEGSNALTNTSCDQSPCTFTPGSPAGQTVRILVYAVSHGYTSDPATILHSTEPGRVRGLTGIAGVTSIKLTWTAPENSVQAYYKVTITNIVENRFSDYTISADTSPLGYALDSLHGGYVYNVEVRAVSKYAEGHETSEIFRTLPEPVSNLTGVAVDTTTIRLTWINPSNSYITSVNISILTPGGDNLYISEDGNVTSHIAMDLIPGERYQFSVSVYSRYSSSSEEVVDYFYTKPVQPKVVSVVAGERSLDVTLVRAEELGVFDSIQASLEGKGDAKTSDANGLVTFGSLDPGTQYRLKAFTLSGPEASEYVYRDIFTRPRPPRDLNIVAFGGDTLMVSWEEPDTGGFDNFTVTVVEMDSITHPKTMTTSELKVEFSFLQPGTTYNVSVVAIKGDQTSQAIWDQNTTNPESVAALQKVEASTNSIMVNWTVPTSVNIDFFNLGIKAVDPTAPQNQLEVNVPLSRTNTTFQNLQPGREYLIAIRTAKRVSPTRPILYGPSVRLNALTIPLPVENLEVVTVNTTALSFTWSTNQTSHQDQFLITYEADDVSRSLTVPASSNSSNYETTVDQLISGYTYTIKVAAVRAIETDTEESDVVNGTGYTVPLGVRNLTLTPDPPDLRVTWSPPASGKWDSYRIEYRPILRDSDSSFSTRTSTQAEPYVRITDLFPGEQYQVKVTVLSNNLQSEEVENSIIMNPLSAKDVHQVKESTTTNSVTLAWTYDTENTVTYQWTFRISDGGVTTNREVLATKEQDYSLVLTDLVPGQTYNIEVVSQVNESSSEPFTLQVTTKPVMNSVLIPAQSTNSSFRITYSILAADIYDHLEFSLMEQPGADPITREKNQSPREVEFTDLEAGTKYTVKAVAVSRGEKSSPKTLEMITDPNPVHVEFEPTARTVKPILGSQQGGVAQYNITCWSLDDGNSFCGQQTVLAGQQPTPFDKLTPFQMYSFTVVTQSEMLRGERKTAVQTYEVTTAEAPPGPVVGLSVQDEGLHTVTLDWQPPDVTNGILRSYHVAYHGNEPTDPQSKDLKMISDIDKSTTSLRIDDLNAGFVYTFTVLAVTVGEGTPTEVEITMKTAAPSFKAHLTAASSKPKAPEGKEGKVTPSTITLDFINPFSTDNGYIRYYTIVVSTDPTAVSNSPTLPSWSEAKKDSSIKMFQALGQCADFFTSGSTCGVDSKGRRRRAANDLSSRLFVVGGQSTADCEGKDFCNGPLSEDTDYYVKLRGYTASGFQETEYSEKIRTAASASSNAGVVVGIVVPIVILIILGAAIAFFVIRRRRRPKRATKHAGPKTTWEHSTMNKFSRPVKLSDFPTHVRKMAQDSDLKYAEEYEDLKEVGRDQPCLAAEFPPNRPKNRFTNILPYDHSRVKLLPTDDEEGSDYINANYMPGYNSKREYIATQGPLPATRDDFWRMVWEQSTRNIVMLTRCQEKGREKSDHYWPSDSEPKFYGDLQVVILNETHMPDWTVTEFKVSLGEQSRNVRHFHYRVWPDFGVPKDPTSLIRFVRTVRDKLIREGGPIITHCSAGVGRSGTFIVLDHLLQLIREKDEVDIFSIVYKLRRERVLMVQTEQQYKFIHECLLCVLEGREEDTTYANVGQVNVGFDDDEGINVEAA